jgi:hypothetical protein
LTEKQPAATLNQKQGRTSSLPEVEAMRITDGTEICQVCGKVPSIIYCDYCEKPLCRSCRKFDMWQQGCGSIPTKVFCVACATNPWVNPWGSMMD